MVVAGAILFLEQSPQRAAVEVEEVLGEEYQVQVLMVDLVGAAVLVTLAQQQRQVVPEQVDRAMREASALAIPVLEAVVGLDRLALLQRLLQVEMAVQECVLRLPDKDYFTLVEVAQAFTTMQALVLTPIRLVLVLLEEETDGHLLSFRQLLEQPTPAVEVVAMRLIMVEMVQVARLVVPV
jgi:hypothetical protein